MGSTQFSLCGGRCKAAPGVLGFHVKPKRSNVLQNQNLTRRLASNNVRVLTRDHVLQNLSNIVSLLIQHTMQLVCLAVDRMA